MGLRSRTLVTLELWFTLPDFNFRSCPVFTLLPSFMHGVYLKLSSRGCLWLGFELIAGERFGFPPFPELDV